jgi:hypothetical protein
MTYPPVWDQSELGLLELVGGIFAWFADQNQPFTILHMLKGLGHQMNIVLGTMKTESVLESMPRCFF